MSESSFVRKTSASSRPLFGGRRPTLSRLDVELTERCDNDCVHCNINLPLADEEARRKELPTSEVKRILAEAAELGALAVRFTGGEPLVREDFDEIYLFARGLGLKVHLFTNARRVTVARAALLSRIPPLEKIEVTVYGMKKASYEAVSRVRGSWEEFRRGVELLLEYRIPFLVKGVVLPATKGEKDEFEAWARTIPGMPPSPSYVEILDHRARRDDGRKNQLIDWLREAQGPALPSMRDEALEGKRLFCSRFLAPPGDSLFSCGAGYNGTVDAYGGVQPCLQLRHPGVVFDLKTGALRDAMQVFFPKMREARATDPLYLARCARCFLRGLCQQCPAKSWMEHGTLDTPVEYLCQRAHVEARAIGLLGEAENAWEVLDSRDRIDRLRTSLGSQWDGGPGLTEAVSSGAATPEFEERSGDHGEQGREEAVGKAGDGGTYPR